MDGRIDQGLGTDLDADQAKLLVASAAEMIGIVDEPGIVRYLNETGRETLGFEPVDVVGKSVFDLVHPDEVEYAVESLSATVSHGRLHAIPLEVRVGTADGSWRYLEIVATNLLNDPRVRGVVLSCRDISYRDASNRRFRLMFEQSPVALALVAPEGSGVVSNATFARLFETSREALLGLRAEDLVHPEDRAQAVADRALLTSHDRARVFGERRYVRANGETFVGRASTSVLHDLDGAVEYVSMTIEDVSLELSAAQALASSQAHARALVDSSPDIIAILYPDGEWEASDQGTRLLGYPKGFEPDGGVFSLVHPDDFEAAAAALGEVLAGTRPAAVPIEVRLRAADGAYRDFECVGQNLEHDPRIGGVVVTARDISERKRAEQKLRAAEERFRVAFEQAPMIVSMVDLDGVLIDINPIGCRMLGYSRDALVGRPAEYSVHAEDREVAIALTTRQLGGEPVAAEFRLETAFGKEIFVLSQAQLVAGVDGAQEPYVITLQADITDRKALERELERRAAHDDLTGLWNRSSLVNYLEKTRQSRVAPPLAVMFIDLDDFKTINDTLGHDAGDAVLRATASRLVSVARAGDLAARWGGDEFIVACEHAGSVDDVWAIAERIRGALVEPIQYGECEIRCDASIGVALAGPDDDPGVLVDRADAAAYTAKRSGKGRTVLSDACDVPRFA